MGGWSVGLCPSIYVVGHVMVMTMTVNEIGEVPTANQILIRAH